MDPSEAQARATIAAALIVRGVVEVPLPSTEDEAGSAAGFRLQEMTDYIYRLVTMTEAPDPPTAREDHPKTRPGE
jgi:hypothetical protein